MLRLSNEEVLIVATGELLTLDQLFDTARDAAERTRDEKVMAGRVAMRLLHGSPSGRDFYQEHETKHPELRLHHYVIDSFWAGIHGDGELTQVTGIIKYEQEAPRGRAKTDFVTIRLYDREGLDIGVSMERPADGTNVNTTTGRFVVGDQNGGETRQCDQSAHVETLFGQIAMRAFMAGVEAFNRLPEIVPVSSS